MTPSTIADFPASREIHVAGIVVYVHPQRLQATKDAIAALPSLEVHGASPNGKLVVTIETGAAAETLSAIETVQKIDGVLSAVVVYQHSEELESMDEEVFP